MPKSKKKPTVNKYISKKPKVNRKSSAKVTKIAKSTQLKTVKNPDAIKKPIRQDSKQSKMIALMQREEGATIEELISATGWQKHSVRGVISGALKKKLGLQITYYKEERGKIYRAAGSR